MHSCVSLNSGLSVLANRSRPSLLFLAQTLPYPPDGGVKIRTYHIMRLLAKDFDITALCFYRWKKGVLMESVENAVRGLKGLAEVRAFPIPQEHSRLRFALDHARSCVNRRVYTAFTYASGAYRKALQELLASRRFHLVHVDSLDLSRYLPFLDDLPVVCVHHDAESQLLQRRADLAGSLLQRAYVRWQATLMAKEERFWLPRVRLNVTVSEEDKLFLSNAAPASRFAVVPNGVDTDFFRPNGEESIDVDNIVFVGGTTWFPNRDALKYFSESIFPAIRRKLPACTTTWVGRASEEEKRQYGSVSGLALTGYVQDIRPLIRNSGCYVVPLRVGGGTRIKILDAWAMGKAVVSTSIGCEGLDAINGRNILIRDAPQDFAEAVREVLSDNKLRERLGREARRTVEATYSWKVIGDKMKRYYEELL